MYRCMINNFLSNFTKNGSKMPRITMKNTDKKYRKITNLSVVIIVTTVHTSAGIEKRTNVNGTDL